MYFQGALNGISSYICWNTKVTSVCATAVSQNSAKVIKCQLFPPVNTYIIPSGSPSGTTHTEKTPLLHYHCPRPTVPLLSCAFLMLRSYFILLNVHLIHSKSQNLFWKSMTQHACCLSKWHECVFGTDRCGMGWALWALCAVYSAKYVFYAAAMVQMSYMICQERERELWNWSWLEANGAVWHFIFRHSSGTAPGVVRPFDWSVSLPLRFKRKYLNNWIHCHEIWPHWDDL